MLEKKHCTKAQPMPLEQKDNFFWIHDNFEAVRPFLNLTLYRCLNCDFYFTALPLDSPFRYVKPPNNLKEENGDCKSKKS